MVKKTGALLWGILAWINVETKSNAQCIWPEVSPGSYTDSVQTVHSRFLKQIQDIQQNPCQPGGIVFTGSSSIRIWKNLASDFPDLPVCNTGFGGSTLPELLHYLPQLVLNQKPKGLVVYCGENDISLPYSTVADIVDQFRQLADSLNLHLPKIPIWYISVKPSLRSRAFLVKQECVNREIQAIIAAQHSTRWHYVDVRTPMLSPEGEPRPDLFLRDGLHMNENGYKIWQTQLQNKIAPYWLHK